MRLLRAIVIRARVDGRIERPDILVAVRLNPPSEDALATQGESIYWANSRDSVLAADLEILDRIVNDPSLWLTYYKPALTDEERIRLFHHLVSMTRVAERNWQQYQTGALDEETWRSYQSGFVGTLTAPQPRKWWEATRNFGMFDPEFTLFVNELLSAANASTNVVTEEGVFPFFD